MNRKRGNKRSGEQSRGGQVGRAEQVDEDRPWAGEQSPVTQGVCVAYSQVSRRVSVGRLDLEIRPWAGEQSPVTQGVCVAYSQVARRVSEGM